MCFYPAPSGNAQTARAWQLETDMTLTCENVKLASDNMESPEGFTDTRASDCLANSVVCLFDFANGERMLDFYAVYSRVRKIFGNSFAFCFGFGGDNFKIRVAKHCADQLRAFLLRDGESGVALCDREVEGLSPVELSAPSVHDCFGRSLLISTGEVSLMRDIAVYLRVDVREPTNSRSILEVQHIMFSDERGNSLAGLADIPEPVAGVQDADKAFKSALGPDYDAVGVNAQLFRAWSLACRDEFDVDLTAFVSPDYDDNRDVICHFRRRKGWWHWAFSINGEEYRIGELIGIDKTLAANWSEATCAVDSLFRRIKALSPDQVIAAVNFDHILDANHLARFSDSYIEILSNDPETAGVRLYEGIQEAIGNLSCHKSAYLPFFFNRGQERGVKYAGEAFETVPSLLLPLYLTNADRERCVPSGYLVACLATKVDGSSECKFPTVLDVATATVNHRHFRHAVRRGLWSRHNIDL